MNENSRTEQAPPLIDTLALRRAIIAGTAAQVVLSLSAHFSNWVTLYALLFGGMMISAISGYLYAMDVAKGFRAGAFGGVISGGICGLFGIALSVTLGDTDPGLFAQYTLIYALTGAIGGLFGQMAASMQASR